MAFVDYELADPSNNEFVLLRLNDFLYVQFNRAKLFNAGTSLHHDKVVVVIGEGGLSSSSSVLRAGLGPRESSSWKGMTIEVCSLWFSPSASSSMDYADVSVYPMGSTSECAFEPSPQPTSETGPTSRPSLSPSSAPSFSATTQPTTRSPVTRAPTLQPTPVTPDPSPFPTTTSPTLHPTPRSVSSPSVTSAPVAPFARPSVPVAQWVQVGNGIGGEGIGDSSGTSIALSSNGDVLVVGGWLNNGGGGNSGHVRVHMNTGGGWRQLGEDLDGAAGDEWFGFSVASSADGMTVAVGAPRADGVFGVIAGRVDVYVWNGSVWAARGSKIESRSILDLFGFSVALSDDGNVLAVGAPESSSGRVQVFAWFVADWNPMGSDLEGSSGDNFGDAVTLSSSGLTLACNARGNGGSVHVYHWSGGTWIRRGSALNGFPSGDIAGRSVSLSGDGMILAVGAGERNSCHVYEYDGTDWSLIGQTINLASGGEFGHEVALSLAGDTVVIGGLFHRSTGIAQVYRLTPNREQWVQVGQDLVGQLGDVFGAAVSISANGSRIAVGASQVLTVGSEPGYVRVYDLQG